MAWIYRGPVRATRRIMICEEYGMRTNVDLDDELVAEAFALTGVQTERELLRLALSELIRVRRKNDLSELAGQISLRDDFDHKAMRATRRDPG